MKLAFKQNVKISTACKISASFSFEFIQRIACFLWITLLCLCRPVSMTKLSGNFMLILFFVVFGLSANIHPLHVYFEEFQPLALSKPLNSETCHNIYLIVLSPEDIIGHIILHPNIT